MFPATKTHQDIGRDNPGVDASDGAPGPVGNDPNRDHARQEYKNEADIQYMLSRFGIVPPRGAPVYGEWDDSIDLMTALNAVNEARDAYAKLPDELRKKFTSMEEILTAYNNGSLVIKDEPAPEEKPPQPPSA